MESRPASAFFRNEIQGNHFLSSLVTAGQQNQVVGNYFQFAGILENLGASNNFYKGNTISKNFADGIKLRGPATVISNTLYGNSGDGVLCFTSGNSIVVNNTLSANVMGIEVVGGLNNTLMGNTIFGNSQYGLSSLQQQ